MKHSSRKENPCHFMRMSLRVLPYSSCLICAVQGYSSIKQEMTSYSLTLIFLWKTPQYSLVLAKTTLHINYRPLILITVKVKRQPKILQDKLPAFCAIIYLMCSLQRDSQSQGTSCKGSTSFFNVVSSATHLIKIDKDGQNFEAID